jgi:hypothetical protein
MGHGASQACEGRYFLQGDRDAAVHWSGQRSLTETGRESD